MLELRTFGGLGIRENGVPLAGAAVQRKTLALLALLAAAGRKGVSRDRLVAYLWPERDADHARHLLKQACYALRHDLNEPELLIGATELRLNPAVISSDVQVFEEALGGGDLAAAVRAYAGPFLDGFYVDGAGEFERWADAERARLLHRACRALESIAVEATARSDVREAVGWWRRLSEVDPLSSRAALGLMTALVAAGEPAAAIQHARVHEAFLHEELGAAPDAAVLALVKRLCDEAEHGSPSAVEGVHPRRRQFTRDFVLAALPGAMRREWRRATTLSAAAVLVVAFAGVGVAVGFWGRHTIANPADPVPVPGRKMLVVLPFENRGAAADEYFADGLTEAIATRLGSIQRLGVIAWPSASQYKGTHKSPQQIGRELGVQYILEGSVRWDRGPGASRVRVSPTLIRASDAAQLWADQYDTTLTGVFAVQTNLATRVAGALDIAVMDAERLLLEARQTTNLQAYDLYLRGRELVDREYFTPASVRTAIGLYERAVALDSNFALAYTWLSVGLVWLHVTSTDRSPDLLSRGKAALDRALRLDPDLPESHGALGFYDSKVLGDNDRALEELTRARRMRPNEPYFAAVLADISASQGRWNEALAYRREAVALDPLNVYLASGPALTYAELRQFTVATYYYDRALALRPESFDAQVGKALAYLGHTGDLAGAQRLLPDMSRPLDGAGGGAPVFSLSDIATLLDAKRQARLLSLAPPALEGDSAVLALTKALVLRASGRNLEARAQFDSARTFLDTTVRHWPSDDYYAALLGLALAGLGRSGEAIREGKRAVDLVPISKDAESSGYLHANLARIYVLLDQPDNAIEQLEIVLSRPGPLSAGWLRADPFWDPLRGSPQFRRLAAARN
jgi:TolB-like protein/DNA-binding SARP family transcriptional activator/tetratricopeptide (TPR) repeat protein